MKVYVLINDQKTVFRLGQNASENHQLVDESCLNDWWFHLSDFGSGHCIVEKLELTNEDIIYASNLIKENSKYKYIKKLSFCYTQVKNIKKTKNPGEVIILNKPNYFIL